MVQDGRDVMDEGSTDDAKAVVVKAAETHVL
jgi:hypothetical protein